MNTNEPKTALPTDSAARKDIPIARGCLDYFPAALAAVAELSRVGNEKHNPGEDLHWARGKSMDHADCILRHLADRGTIDTDGLSHSVKVAWRALALLQEELEAAGAPMARGARLEVAAPVVKELAWNEGWKCPDCGTTEVWEDEYDRSFERDGFLLCNTSGCSGHMVRL